MTNQEKLERAKQILGKRWVLHPEYRREENPAHKFYGSYVMAQVARRAIKEGRAL